MTNASSDSPTLPAESRLVTPRSFLADLVPRGREQWLLLTALFVFVTGWRFILNRIVDDAMITYRYAENIALGYGFVYNLGEPVLGTTTPLYTVLLSLPILVGIPPWYFSLGLDCLLMTGLLWMVLRVVWRDLGVAATTAAALAIAHSPFLLMPLGGMETAVFMFLCYFALRCATVGLTRAAALLAFLSFATRPEGAVTMMLVALMAAIEWKPLRFNRQCWKSWAILGGCTGAYIAAITWYFGSPIPQSVVAKHFQGAVAGGVLFIDDFFANQFMPMDHIIGSRFFSPWGILEYVGLIVVWRRSANLRPFIVWLTCYVLFMMAGKAPSYLWYYTPLYPIRMVLLGVAGLAIVEWVMRALKYQPATWSRVAYTAAVLIATGVINLKVQFDIHKDFVLNRYPTVYYKKYEEAGKFLGRRAAPHEEVMAGEIGYLGYFSKIRLFDIIGLVSPEALEGDEAKSEWDWMKLRRSEWVMLNYPVETSWVGIPQHVPQLYSIAGTWEDGYFRTYLLRRREKPLPAIKKGFGVGFLPSRSQAGYGVVGGDGRLITMNFAP